MAGMEKLNLSDLFNACDKCGGTGHYEWRADPNATRGIGTQQIGSFGPCDKCGGRGGSFTENGEVLAQFVQVLKRQHRI